MLHLILSLLFGKDEHLQILTYTTITQHFNTEQRQKYYKDKILKKINVKIALNS